MEKIILVHSKISVESLCIHIFMCREIPGDLRLEAGGGQSFGRTAFQSSFFRQGN